jgi:hypothetical protein
MAYETITPEGRRSIPSVSIEVNTIVKMFAGKPPGTFVSHENLCRELGCRKPRLYVYIVSARRILQRRHSLWLETVRGEGLRVASADGVLQAMSTDMTRSNRALRAGGRKADLVDVNALSSDEKRKELAARITLVGVQRIFSAPSAVVRVQREITSEALPSAKVLDLFK